MRIVTYKRIQEFATKHPNTQAPLNVWYHTITAKSWQNLTDIKHDFNSVDYVGNHRYVFNIKGVKWYFIFILLTSLSILYSIDPLAALLTQAKLIIVFVIIIPVLIIFIMASQVNWTLGITLAVGQSFGAWLAAKFALEHPKASVWVHRLLVVMVVVAIIKLFKLYLYLPF